MVFLRSLRYVTKLLFTSTLFANLKQENPSPPQSPPLAAIAASQKKHSSPKNAGPRGGGAFTIAEECERLFCETLKTTFLGEGDLDFQDSLAMGAHINSSNNIHSNIGQYAMGSISPPLSSSLSSSSSKSSKRLLTDWLEVYDYAGGARFRGFIEDGGHSRSMFAFFDKSVLGNDLKPG